MGKSLSSAGARAASRRGLPSGPRRTVSRSGFHGSEFYTWPQPYAHRCETVGALSKPRTSRLASGVARESNVSEVRDRGQRTYKQLFGHFRDEPSGSTEAFDSFTLDHLFANVWSRPGLEIRDRSLATVSILAALGRDEELKSHVAGLHRQGFSRSQFTELMIHVAHYAGWPAGHHGLRIAQEVMDAIDAAETPVDQ
jgi:4-carboxymuconolactone decarboxylase